MERSNMVKETLPVKKSCKHKSCAPNGGKDFDAMSELPDEVLISILSRVTLKEAARTSLVSRRWKHLWRWTLILDFENSTAMEQMSKKELSLELGRSSFVEKVNHVMEQHLGPTIDELRITFDLEISSKSHIDKWVVGALEKHVERLELDFESAISWNYWPDGYTLPLEGLVALNGGKNFPRLKYLILKELNVSTEVIEWFLSSCPSIEHLCIEWSPTLSFRVSGSSSKLMHIELLHCFDLETFDVSASSLKTLKYSGRTNNLIIANASVLSEVSVGVMNGLSMAPVFDSLSKYFSQLEYLRLHLFFSNGLNLTPKFVPTLKNLKHLGLAVSGECNESLLGWTCLIEACPQLEKLTIEMPIVKPGGQPLKCLKTLELLGFKGRRLDTEICTYVFDNAPTLELFILDFKEPDYDDENVLRVARRRFRKFIKIIPEGLKVVLKNYY